MITFDGMVFDENVPIYQQILTHIKRGIVSGSIQNNDELPSRRVLSSLLGVNPNTIQKAYRTLEEEGLIESHSGAKSYVILSELKIAKVKEELLADEIKKAVTALKQMGLSKDETIELINTHWGEEK